MFFESAYSISRFNFQHHLWECKTTIFSIDGQKQWKWVNLLRSSETDVRKSQRPLDRRICGSLLYFYLHLVAAGVISPHQQFSTHLQWNQWSSNVWKMKFSVPVFHTSYRNGPAWSCREQTGRSAHIWGIICTNAILVNTIQSCVLSSHF